VSGEAEVSSVRFEPLRPASRGRIVAALILGPIIWLVALVVCAWVVRESWAIAAGLIVTVAAFLVSLLVLTLIHVARRREERRYAERG
jgi:divalent metal cation (Fe/Co/Zn/Cd) transporter